MGALSLPDWRTIVGRWSMTKPVSGSSTEVMADVAGDKRIRMLASLMPAAGSMVTEIDAPPAACHYHTQACYRGTVDKSESCRLHKESPDRLSLIESKVDSRDGETRRSINAG